MLGVIAQGLAMFAATRRRSQRERAVV
jgi:hypothetical protein